MNVEFCRPNIEEEDIEREVEALRGGLSGVGASASPGTWRAGLEAAGGRVGGALCGGGAGAIR